MISENQNQSVEVPTVEKKKRNYTKKETKAAEAVAIVANPKAKIRPTREKKQAIEQNDVSEEIDYEKVKTLIDNNPSIAEEFQSIINKHLK